MPIAQRQSAPGGTSKTQKPTPEEEPNTADEEKSTCCSEEPEVERVHNVALQEKLIRTTRQWNDSAQPLRPARSVEPLGDSLATSKQEALDNNSFVAGTITRMQYAKGYGFIARSGHPDTFVHRKSVTSGVLLVGDHVEFVVVGGRAHAVTGTTGELPKLKQASGQLPLVKLEPNAKHRR